MVYIDDILLNFNKNLLEFFEWEEDEVLYVKKIPVFKVQDNVIDDFINNNVRISNDFYNSIKNKTILYDDKDISKDEEICLISNNDMVLGILIKDYQIIYLSRMLLDEEYDCLKIANKLSITDIKYEVISKRKVNKQNLTRKEILIKNLLYNEFNNLYNNNLIEKLNYYYFEYFKVICNEKEKVFKSLINSLNDFNIKHISLFSIYNLSNKNM